MAGISTNGLPLAVPFGTAGGQYFAATGYETVAADTAKSSGGVPQSVALTAFQIAALAAGLAANAATESANAATLNTLSGTITTSSLTTAAGGTYVITLTNSTVTATSNVQAAIYDKTNTTPGVLIQSIVPAAGSVVITLKNNGSAALNGTCVVAFQVAAE